MLTRDENSITINRYYSLISAAVVPVFTWFNYKMHLKGDFTSFATVAECCMLLRS